MKPNIFLEQDLQNDSYWVHYEDISLVFDSDSIRKLVDAWVNSNKDSWELKGVGEPLDD